MATPTFNGANSTPRIGPLIISEIHHSPAAPHPQALEIVPQVVSSDLEFVEIYNPTDEAVSLLGWQLSGGIELEFGDVVIPGKSARVVVPSETFDSNMHLRAFEAHYDIASANFAGGYRGNLNSTGELVQLMRRETADNELVLYLEDQIVYDDLVPWPTDSTGTGNGLTRRSTSSFGRNPNSWQSLSATPGQSGFEGGLPGDFNMDANVGAEDIDALCLAIHDNSNDQMFDLNNDSNVDVADHEFMISNILNTVAGDTNLDGIFDSQDLVIIFQAGLYEDGVPNNSTWVTGDWNCDGEFGSSDLVVAFQTGKYVGGV